MSEDGEKRCRIKETWMKFRNWKGWEDDRPNSCGGLIITGLMTYALILVCVFLFACLRAEKCEAILRAIRDGVFATTITFALPIIAENTMPIKRFKLTMFQFFSLILFILFGVIACLEETTVFGMIFLFVATAALISLILVIRYGIDRKEGNRLSA